jgi:8-oxo-dGTP pyrophosphatase MutT (NUDIX family)
MNTVSHPYFEAEVSLKAHPCLQDILLKLKPWDSIEASHIEETLKWVQSGAEIYRIKKPDIPKKHLAAYYVLIDIEKASFLLVNHRAAKGWIPGGGHCDPLESPVQTIQRELWEELKVTAPFLWENPLFLTVADVGMEGFGRHTDVTFWYVLSGKESMLLKYDNEEFTEARWFPLKELPASVADPHFSRFIEKLRFYLT